MNFKHITELKLIVLQKISLFLVHANISLNLIEKSSVQQLYLKFPPPFNQKTKKISPRPKW